jgi:hypothetical protein
LEELLSPADVKVVEVLQLGMKLVNYIIPAWHALANDVILEKHYSYIHFVLGLVEVHFFFFVVLGLDELRAYISSYSTSPFL